MTEIKPIVFKIGSELYGIDICNVSAIEKDQVVVPVPNSSESIKGIINHRGEIIPVYSLRGKFRLPKTSDTSQLIITNLPNMKLAIEVDEVDEINNIDENQINDFPRLARNSETKFFTKVVNNNGRLILLIDINNLLTDEEEENAKQLMEEK